MLTSYKKLIVVCGMPAVGKTTYAKGLALNSMAAIIDIDTCTEPIVKVALAELGHDPFDRDSAYFKQKYREVIYETLFAIAKDNLISCNVIVVGPFTKEIGNENWPDELEKVFGIKPEIHYVSCNPEVRKQRMQQRANARDKAKLAEWEKSQSYYGVKARPKFDHIFIDNS